ncbi:hypothetical protein RHMOL_Rhmol03G0160200 [Rhododendron molle]|uniref:Uncharacterized protein n=1 Tax=Rhododendron molle TaxID=49168 RepID=A0ACC0PHT0_RHOML|nr:hypothetical protein RHMOL_Rhmol03G0160200 [Rhododendron molle]
MTLNPISTPPHSRSLDFAASINGLSGSSLHQFLLTRFSLPSSSSSNYLNGWISTPLPDRDREPRGVEARAAESCAGEEEEDAKASGLSKTLELGSLFGLWFLFNIYFNIYNKQVDDCSLSSLPLPWKRRTQDHHSKLPSIAHHNLHFYLLILGFSFDVNIGLQWNFRSLEGIWMGRKRGREKEKKMPIFLGIASDFALYPNPRVFMYFLLSVKTQVLAFFVKVLAQLRSVLLLIRLLLLPQAEVLADSEEELENVLVGIVSSTHESLDQTHNQVPNQQLQALGSSKQQLVLVLPVSSEQEAHSLPQQMTPSELQLEEVGEEEGSSRAASVTGDRQSIEIATLGFTLQQFSEVTSSSSSSASSSDDDDEIEDEVLGSENDD